MLEITPAPNFDQSFRNHFIQVYRRLPSRARIAVIKTWTNGWATTERFHEEVILPCIFGCGGSDSLTRYLQCEHLWSLLLSVTHGSATALSDPPIRRACLDGISLWSILNCWYAFQVYHALKIERRRTIDQAVGSEVFDEVLDIALELLRLFAS